MDGYTRLSQAMFGKALSASLTASEACDWLMSTTDFRTLPEKLTRFYQGTEEELKALLRKALCELHPDPKEGDAIRHNVRNWFTPPGGIDSRVISPQYALEICFILKLPIETADEFLKSVTGEGIHYRSLDEFVLAYGLMQGMDCRQAMLLRDRIVLEAGLPAKQALIPQGYTKLLREEAASLSTEAELRDYVRDHKDVFGAFHNTAYEYFTDMMDVLQNEGTGASVDELVMKNLFRRFVDKRGKLSDVEKQIRAGWPEESQMSKMRGREIPVTRKVLILLFLASGGGISNAPPSGGFYAQAGPCPPEDGAELPDEEEGFEAVYVQMNAMLAECGFAPIDPRSPFDWMVLFCMATGDVFDFDQRFEDVLSQLYGNKLQEERP